MASEHLFYRFKHDGSGNVLLTNDFGKYLVLSEDDFEKIEQKNIPAELKTQLQELSFLLTGADLNKLAEALHKRLEPLRHGPAWHTIFVNTADGEAAKMSLKTAKSALDMALSTSSPQVNLSIKGDEPLAHWEATSFLVETAREQAPAQRKQVHIRLYTNFVGMDEEKQLTLSGPEITVCPLFSVADILDVAGKDAPDNSPWYWVKNFVDLADIGSGDIEIQVAASADELSRQGDALIDALDKIGISRFHLRPFDPMHMFGEGLKVSAKWTEAYQHFGSAQIDALVAGKKPVEFGYFGLFEQVFSPKASSYPSFREVSSPGFTELVYGHDGHIFASELARALHDEGEDDSFLLGKLGTESISTVLEGDVPRSLALASSIESQPLYSDHAYAPYLAIDPVLNYGLQGDIFGQLPTNPLIRRIVAGLDAVFARVLAGDTAAVDAMKRVSVPEEPATAGVGEAGSDAE